MKYSKFISNRFLYSRKRKFFKRTHLLPLLGIIIGVFAYLSVSAVMNGFDRDITDRIVGVKSEVLVYNADRTPFTDYASIREELLKEDGVIAVAPVSRVELMLMKGKNTAGTALYGVNFVQQATVSPLFKLYPRDLSEKSGKIRRGIFTGYRSPEKYADNTILLGYDLAMELRAIPGDKIKVMAPIGTIPSPFGLMPKTRELVVGGLFMSGMPEYDKLFSLTTLDNCAFFLPFESGAQYLELRTGNPRSSLKLIKRLQVKYPNLLFEDWSSFDRNMYQAMRLEKVVMMAILSLMILITSFNLTGNFAKMIARQRKDIGILKSLGCNDRDIFNIYLRQGITIGFTGTISGVVLAIMFIVAQSQWHIIKIPAGNLPMSALPVDPRLLDFIVITAICLVISFLATLFPALQAKKIDPLKIIRQ